MNASSRHEFQRHLFEAIEFRLEIAPIAESCCPPIIQDVRKGPGGVTGYRHLHRLDIEDSARIADFKSLKISTHLPLDTIILELALSRKAPQGDYTLQIPDTCEQLIGTYLISAGETVVLTELAQFGLAPMRAKAFRLHEEHVPLTQLPLVNHTTGLQVISAKKKANIYSLTLKNVSDRTIFRFNYGVESLTWRGVHTTQDEIPAGAEMTELVHLPLRRISRSSSAFQITSEPYTIVIGAVIYGDKSCEGKESWLYSLFFNPLHQEQLAQFLPAHLRELYEATQIQNATEVSSQRSEIQAKMGDVKTLLSGVKIQGMALTEQEIAQRIFLAWVQANIERRIQSLEWMRANQAAQLDESKLASLSETIERNKQLLHSFPPK